MSKRGTFCKTFVTAESVKQLAPALSYGKCEDLLSIWEERIQEDMRRAAAASINNLLKRMGTINDSQPH